MMHHQEYNQMGRRRMLSSFAGPLAFAATGLISTSRPAFGQVGDQPDWRFCKKCDALFFNGAPDKGHCAASGSHLAQGFRFSVHFDSNQQGSQLRQYAWRYCEKCFVLFFDGSPFKGRCAAGGGHAAQGLMFGLDFQPAAAKHQSDWRFCNKCNGLFFNGSPMKGACPAGGGHTAQGLMFNLPYRIDPLDFAGDAVSEVLERAVTAHRPEVEKAIKDELGRGDLIRGGVTLYNIDFRLGVPSFRFDSHSFDYHLADNYLYFKSTTPTVFGSYADPAFEVHFESALVGGVIPAAGGKFQVSRVVASVPRIEISPRNVTGGIVTTVVHFFQLTEPGGRAIQQAHQRYLSADLTRMINDNLARLPAVG
jgi:hypothetical protein